MEYLRPSYALQHWSKRIIEVAVLKVAGQTKLLVCVCVCCLNVHCYQSHLFEVWHALLSLQTADEGLWYDAIVLPGINKCNFISCHECLCLSVAVYCEDHVPQSFNISMCDNRSWYCHESLICQLCHIWWSNWLNRLTNDHPILYAHFYLGLLIANRFKVHLLTEGFVNN